ncbi:OmpH family outer membrane protein [Neolewinella agarilytica]|uniref:Periplasmic chaperone for outer membrane proteins Skp n=1 Tax=Neolewinella agarilytica TaxID=478744 RepID=A0A1H9IRQ6_9BACT|nr:OmpH family outer membrane protein [Neolewinella agarilytica]SEQ77197.1 periplasmic chaperone for outer membrane proteins Skp [Neolewinella agarilytica]
MKHLLFSLLLLFATVSVSHAQKFGHVNFGNLLSEMPEVKASETELEAFNQQLIKQGEKMVEDLKAAVAKAEANSLNTTPKELEQIKQRLQQDQAAIQQFEREMVVKIEQKRQELLGPIIKKAREAIDAVAKENGYQMVFDSSLFNSLLFTEDSSDMMELVKAKLGI